MKRALAMSNNASELLDRALEYYLAGKAPPGPLQRATEKILDWVLYAE